MLYSNALIFTPDGWVHGAFRTENGMFAGILSDGTAGEDLRGAKVLPGLVDIHIHGAAGADASDADAEGLRAMRRRLASGGVTAFLPTVMSLPPGDAAAALRTIRSAREDAPDDSARILGARLEGPFLSPERRGAQNLAFLREPDDALFDLFWEASGGLIRITDAAPGLPGALPLTRKIAPRCRVSLGHTAADYDTAAAAFAAGASHVTHLYNAMPPLLHRSPGVIGAAAEREDVTAELICDGVHVHPSAVRSAFRLFGDRLCLISDAMRCCGLPDGEYELGGQTVTVRGREARLPDGTLSGAASDLFEDLRNALRFGVDEAAAIRAATALPARLAGCGDRLGSIEAGKYADFLVCEGDLTLRQVYINGMRIR